MDKVLLKELINKGLSVRSLAKETGKAYSTVRYWLDKYNLKTSYVTKPKLSLEQKIKNSVKRVTERRRMLKKKAIDYLGGRCQFCGYNRCEGALEFHHRDSEDKEFGIASQGHSRSWSRVKEELDKCVLACANCHREIHAGIIKIE